MPWDIAFHPDTGDWLFNAQTDLQSVSGPEQTLQRIKTRLRIHAGSWIYDTDHSLGSELFAGLRIPRDRAIAEIPAYIEQALAPMTDISVEDVQIDEGSNERELEVLVKYRFTGVNALQPQVLEDQLQVNVSVI
jgi:hypothetical protein